MKTKHLLAFILLLSAFGFPLSAFSQGTAFTYQGRLNDANGPATGIYDLRFAIYGAASGGTQVGSTLTNSATAVSNGLFMVTLDFGNQFNGADRWVEIGVRTNDSGAFTILTPRQQITATPYAVTAGAVTGPVAARQVTGSLPVSQVSGLLPLAQLPPAVVTNGASGVNLTGTFAGNASGLTALNAAQLTGAVADAHLSPNVALRAGGNAFSGGQTFSGNVGFSDPATSLTFPATSGANTPMIQLFSSGTVNADRMVIAHSPDYANWGLQYQDVSDQFNFLGNGQSALTVRLAARRVGIDNTNPTTALDVVGTITATAFAGNGAGLTNISASAVAAAPPGMVLIPSGAFTMGDTLDGSIGAAPTNVTLSAFYMNVNPVSWSQWQSVYFWATNHGYAFTHAGAGKAANHPVQTVDWWDCVKWCNARSQQAGKPPVYYTDAGWTAVYMTGEPTTLYPNWTNSGYRLPTEAEWEKAARGGLSGQRFPWGNVINQNLANYQGATASYTYDLGPNDFNPAFTNGGYPYTSPVGSFAANGYGLYDMSGNVFEWCWDWYGTYAGGIDPRGPAGPLGFRVLRGGDWLSVASYARCANRNDVNPSNASDYLGFRCVRGI